ncbi:hypothetical protein [Nocardia sp. CY41]|uniref:hypothetical protein n=1 Tax=Nocardia sp. CY41 TaxID=2608686 RepID=UPI00135BDD82|nr:hypothetical protein [Nocardia sp. CY41]
MTKGEPTTDRTEGGDIPEYPWMLVPAHFRTRRQLRAAGLGPNRQAVAAVVVGTRRGRRLFAHLFDVRKAAPKRVPTPAQLAAITKATTEQQIKAAARRGISRAELAAPGDPGPAWDAETTTTQGGTRMSDTNAFELGVPAGHDQKMAYLLASVALRRAEQQAAELDQAAADAAMGHTDAQTDIDSARAMAEAQLTRYSWNSGRESTMEVLTAAIVWGQDPQLAEVATRRMDELISHYHGTFGVVIDVDDHTVGIDPDFDAEAWQRFTEASIVYDRQAAAVDVLSAQPLDARVLEAVMAWHGEPPTPAGAEMYLATEKSRRAQLSAALADAGASGSARSGVEFVVDYLRGDTSGADLTKTPILVDPALEVRGRVGELLERFAERGEAFGAVIAREVDVMTPEDQLRVREIGLAIRDGRAAEMEPWPDWIDRDELADRVRDFARDARDVTAYANDATDGGLRLDDDVHAMLTDMCRDRPVIDTLLTKQGLHPAERAALTALVADIDNGRVDDHNLPELLLLDERSKRQVDLRRYGHTAHGISVNAADTAKQIIGAGVDMAPRTDAGWALEAVRNDIDALGRGGHTPGLLAENRQSFDENMNKLGRALRAAGADVPTRLKVRAAIDQGVREAGKHGKTRTPREQEWTARLYSSTEAAQRQHDAENQREIAQAGFAHPPERACTARPEPSAARPAAVSGPSGTRIRTLHQGEVGR